MSTPTRRMGPTIVLLATLTFMALRTDAVPPRDEPLDAAAASPGKPAGAPAGPLHATSGLGSCPCRFVRDDGTGEINLGVSGDDATTVAMANAYIASDGCPTIDAVEVAWGETPRGTPMSVAIYNDPNNDGNPLDITAADRLAVAVGITANEDTDLLNEYPIGPVDVRGIGVFFVVASTSDSGTDRPLRLDQGISAMSSWFATSYTDPADPFQTGGVGLVDTFGFPGNFMFCAVGVQRGTCPTDLDGSGGTDVDDLVAVILDWGCGVDTAAECGECTGDADGDTDTDVDDLVGIVLAWGPCPLTNDACVDAPYVLGGSGLLTVGGITCEPVSTVFGVTGARLDEPPVSCVDAASDVWFRIAAACDGTLVIDTDGSDFDTVLEVYDGGDCPATGLLVCDDDSGADGVDSRVALERVVGGQELLVRVAAAEGGGAGVLNVCCAQEVPDNDFCVGAVPILNGLNPFSTEDATTDGPSHPQCATFGDNGITHDDIWFTYVAECGGSPGQTALLTVSTCEDVGGGATYDTDLVIYDPTLVGGAVCDDLESALLGCNDDDALNPCGDPDLFHSRLEVPVIQGQEYLIRVGGWGGLGEDMDFGVGELFVACQPADNDICAFASPISPGGELSIDTCSASVDTLAPICGTSPPDEPGRWVVVTGTGGEMTAALCNLNDGNFPDTRLMVYCGGVASGGVAVDCSTLECVDVEPNDNNDDCPFTETLTWCSADGIQYLILVHGQGSPGCGLIDVTVTESGACVDPPCVALGACCLDDGTTCEEDVIDLVCVEMGGIAFADETCATVVCPCTDVEITMQQHCSDFPLTGVIRCQPMGMPQASNWYYRQFGPADGLTTPFTTCSVEIAIFGADAVPASDGTPMTICLYDVPVESLAFDAEGNTTTTPLACRTMLVTDGMAGTYQTIDVGGTSTTGVLTVEVLTPSGVDGPYAGNILFLAANGPGDPGCLGNNPCGGCGELATSFVRAPFCEVDLPVSFADIGSSSALLWKVNGQ